MENRFEDAEKVVDGALLSGRIILSLTISAIGDNPNESRSCGFHLTRSKWDPYPWVDHVEVGSIADISGLRAGDCLLEINGIDIIGLRVKDIRSLIKQDDKISVNLQIWRSNEFCTNDAVQTNGVAVSGPLPTLAKKMATALSGITRELECPVCLETAISPVAQCVHGHILCDGCRMKTPRCPVCRVRLGKGRCLLADEVQRNIREAFEDPSNSSDRMNGCSLREKLFGKSLKKNENDNQQNLHQINIKAHSKLKSSFPRLIFGGFGKASSAENLTSSNHDQPAVYRRLGEISLGDKTKSASTGELSNDNKNDRRMPLLFRRLATEKAYTSSSDQLGDQPTLVWDQPTTSTTSSDFPCPIRSSDEECKVLITHRNYMEHIGKNHSITQTHFFGLSATIEMPPRENSSIYVFHHLNDLFFLQFKDEMISMIGTSGINTDWMLHGWSTDGTNIKWKKPITKIQESKSPNLLVALPAALKIAFINIEIIYTQSEGFDL